MPTPVRALALTAAVVAHVPPLVFGALTPGFSHLGQYISELGAVGAPYGNVVSVGTFLPAGVLMVLTCFALRRRVPRTRGGQVGLAMVALIGVSWIVAAFAPCDAGCPAEGSARQGIHNLAGLVGYLGGGIGFLLVAGALRATGGRTAWVWATAACGVMVGAGLFVMAAPEMAAVRGGVQRVMELAASGWLVAAAWRDARG